MTTIADRLLHELEDLKPAARGQLWAYLTLPGYAGLSAPMTERKYRKYAARLGVTPGRLDVDSQALMVRLDFERGTEVVRAP